jgi:hypothetical protein
MPIALLGYKMKMSGRQPYAPAMASLNLSSCPLDSQMHLTIFQRYVNKTLCLYLDVFCTTHLDDVLIYSQTWEEHIQHVRQILNLLQQAGLQVKLRKCEFHKTITEFLEILVTLEGMKMDSGKVSTIEQ